MNDSTELTVPARLWQNGDILPGSFRVSPEGVSFLSPSGSPLLDGGELPLDSLETALPYNTYLFIPNGLTLYLKNGSNVQLTLDRRRDVLALLRQLRPDL